MKSQEISPEDIISAGTNLAQAGLEAGKQAMEHGKPIVEASANRTAQVRDTSPCGTDFPPNYCQAAEWGAKNPLLAACAAGAVAVVAPGLATAPILSSLGFTAGGVQAGMCDIPEGDWTCKSCFVVPVLSWGCG